MRWHVQTVERMPHIEIRNVYAVNSIRAAEIVAEIHGGVGLYLVKEEDSQNEYKVLIQCNRIYHGKSYG